MSREEETAVGSFLRCFGHLFRFDPHRTVENCVFGSLDVPHHFQGDFLKEGLSYRVDRVCTFYKKCIIFTMKMIA